MSARGEEAGEASGSQEPDPEPESELEPATAAAEPQKRKPGRPRKPQKEPTGSRSPNDRGDDPRGARTRAPPKAAQK
ncbi:unnamed protein product, partial [Gadus morhua 'NCC']